MLRQTDAGQSRQDLALVRLTLLHTSERDRVLYWTIPEPSTPQTGTGALAGALYDACDEVEQRLDPIVAVVIQSAPSAFCVTRPTGVQDLDRLQEGWAQATSAIGHVRVPTIAVLRGAVVGPSWELALACDLRLADQSVEIGSPELQWSRLPRAGGTQRLPRIAGMSMALRLLLLGEMLSAEQALALRLVHRTASQSDLDATLEHVLDALRTSAPIALAYAKETVHQAGDLALQDGLRLEADLAALLQTTRDRAAGLSAFARREQPSFEGC